MNRSTVVYRCKAAIVHTKVLFTFAAPIRHFTEDDQSRLLHARFNCFNERIVACIVFRENIGRKNLNKQGQYQCN